MSNFCGTLWHGLRLNIDRGLNKCQNCRELYTAELYYRTTIPRAHHIIVKYIVAIF